VLSKGFLMAFQEIFLAGQWVKKDIEDIFHFRKNKIEEIFKDQMLDTR
tara:strand:- start:631 stop:774 length:144 start_codon:yes stop_codon:yes gene_type:complete